MMPDLRRLFPTRRLWAGRGATIRGYGDKRTLVGIQVNGAGDVLTLGRTDKSGVTPSLGTDDEPVSLRAGPGVRLHGYGGIHTLERLPVEVEEVPTLRGTARLEWDVEISIGYATLCSLGVSFDSPGNWVVGWVVTNNNTLGSWVNTATASGVVNAWGGDETEPSECAEVVYTSTEDPEFDYGDYVSTEYSETLVAFEDIFPDAISAIEVLEVLGEAASSGAEWPSENWKDVSNGTIPFGAFLGHVKVYHTADGIFLNQAYALSTRFRVRNAGDCPILADYGFYGSGLPGGATDVAYSTTLGIGQTGDWITAPAIDLDPDKYRTAEIRRVRLSRWRSLP